MFLKTQEDIQNLFREFPLENFTIEIEEGERIGFESSDNHGTIRLNSVNQFIFNIDGPDIMLDESDGFQKKYRYSTKGVRLVNVLKKLSSNDNSIIQFYPIFINGVDLRSKDDEVINLYVKIQKFIQHYNRIKKQYFVLKNTDLDYSHARKNVSYDYEAFNQYLIESKSSHFGLFYRRLLERDSDFGKKISIDKIFTKAKSLGILDKKSRLSLLINGVRKEQKIGKWISDFRDFTKHINLYISHNDEETFDRKIQIDRTSNTTTNITETIIHPSGIFTKLEELIQFIDTFLSEYFLLNPQLHGYGESHYELKLIKTN